MNQFDLLLARIPLGMENLLLLAQEEEKATSYGIAFLILVICLVGGMMATIKVDKRDSEVKIKR